MPAFPFVSIDADDDSVDFGRFKSAGTKTPNGISNGTTTTPSKPSTRTLILAPPSIAAHEEKLHALFAPGAYDRAASDLQMLDRLAAGFVPLTANTYDVVLVLTDADGAQRDEALGLLSTRQVFGALVPAMKNGARLQFQDGARLDGAGAREAILAGLVDKDGVFEKVEEEEVVVPLRLKKKVVPKPAVAMVSPPATTPAKRSAVVLDLGEYSDGEELVDEDSLLTAEERSRPPQQPPACNIDGQKRRKPCKDCTCGLAERLEEEDRDRRSKADANLSNVFKFNSNDLNELDFTVQGKTGSCNSCSLGDAFRCSTCPYIGLPAFKPGEEVKILSGLVQL
ncbi:electron carrier [Sporothrix curviconia]|uniref:Electron carrier n=1 Tax=Sporothrix curviconia TaxID=1260050 RepID=A0ABP0CRG0_9PEZI